MVNTQPLDLDLDLNPGCVLTTLKLTWPCEIGLIILTFRVITSMVNLKYLTLSWNVGEAH